MARKAAAAILVPLAAVALALALVTGYANRAIFDSDQFANRATAALQETAVENKVADAITDDVVLKAQQDLIGLRPVIHTVAGTIIESAQFRSLFRGAVADVHAALFNQDQDTATLALADVGTLLTDALKKVGPKQQIPVIGGRIPRIKIHIEVGQGFIKVVERLHKLEIITPLLLVLGIVCGAGGIALAPDRRRAIVRGGIAAAAVGVVLLLAYHVGRAALLHQVPPSSRAAAGGVWDAFLDDLRTALFIFTGAGAVIAAAAASLIRPVEVAAPLRRAWALIETTPERTWARALRAIAFVVAGIVVITDHAFVLELAFLLLGLYIVYIGVAEILRLITPAHPEERPMQRRHLIEAGIASAVVVVTIGVAGTAYVTGGALNAEGDVAGTCNGFKALCGRPFDDVALPATHNSMSAATESGWLFANQAQSIPSQLDDGIRALLWDTYYGRETPDGHVKTVLTGFDNEKRKQYVDELGREFVDAALRIRDRLPEFEGGGGPASIYLCHRFCETGALPLSQALSEVRDFLVTHPTQVLVIVNEDYVKPKDYVAEVRQAGLEPFVYKGSTTKWPTLGQMVSSNQRLVLLAEKHGGGGASWYHPAYEGIVQETPYTFADSTQLDDPSKVGASCAPNRGGRRGSIFLLNNFITNGPAPRPSVAEKVNNFRPLLYRARLCERIRHAFPNLLAVDFSTAGDVVRVADALNHVAGGQN